jgi:tripartite-type tricarboxylate transporter receptor subunit TctC
MSPTAAQSDYPNRPVRWVLGFAPGGPTDIVVRIIAQNLSEKLGQPFVIENRPGAGGNIATQAVVNAPPDGYTLLAMAHFNAINATLYKQLPFNFIRDMVPVAGMVQMPNVLEVHPSVPAKSVAEFIAYLKANEGKVSYASAGSGSSAHLATELFKAMTGTSMQHIPYRGRALRWSTCCRGR